jgi:hypothetical protein
MHDPSECLLSPSIASRTDAAAFLPSIPVSLKTCKASLRGTLSGSLVFVDKAWISELFSNYFLSEILSTANLRPQLLIHNGLNSDAQAEGEGGAASGGANRAAFATARCCRCAADAQEGPLYPPGVSKTASGKFQARIKLNGKRYDLGSNFNKVEEAAAAYAAAKLTGRSFDETSKCRELRTRSPRRRSFVQLPADV